jgi:hypothetical protein
VKGFQVNQDQTQPPVETPADKNQPAPINEPGVEDVPAQVDPNPGTDKREEKE